MLLILYVGELVSMQTYGLLGFLFTRFSRSTRYSRPTRLTSFTRQPRLTTFYLLPSTYYFLLTPPLIPSSYKIHTKL